MPLPGPRSCAWSGLIPVVHVSCRYHSKALLVTFDSDNTAGSHVDVLTREVQEGFKRLDGEIRGMGTREAGPDDDAQVSAGMEISGPGCTSTAVPATSAGCSLWRLPCRLCRRTYICIL